MGFRRQLLTAFSVLSAAAIVLALPAAVRADSLIGSTANYQVSGCCGSINGVFGSGSAVVSNGVVFQIEAGDDYYSDPASIINVDFSANSISFDYAGNTSWRYGFEQILIYGLNFTDDPGSIITGISTTTSLADPLDESVTFGSNFIDLRLGNSLWEAGNYVQVDLSSSNPNPVPEPSSGGLLGLGLAVLWAAGYRVRSRAKS